MWNTSISRWPKLGRSCPHLYPTWVQAVPCWTQVGPKLEPNGPCWRRLTRIELMLRKCRWKRWHWRILWQMKNGEILRYFKNRARRRRKCPPLTPAYAAPSCWLHSLGARHMLTTLRHLRRGQICRFIDHLGVGHILSESVIRWGSSNPEQSLSAWLTKAFTASERRMYNRTWMFFLIIFIMLHLQMMLHDRYDRYL